MLIQNDNVHNLYKNLVVVKKFSNDHCCIMTRGSCRKKSHARITRGKKLITSVGIDRRARHKGNRGRAVDRKLHRAKNNAAGIGRDETGEKRSVLFGINRSATFPMLAALFQNVRQTKSKGTYTGSERERERKERKQRRDEKWELDKWKNRTTSTFEADFAWFDARAKKQLE